MPRHVGVRAGSVTTCHLNQSRHFAWARAESVMACRLQVRLQNKHAKTGLGALRAGSTHVSRDRLRMILVSVCVPEFNELLLQCTGAAFSDFQQGTDGDIFQLWAGVLNEFWGLERFRGFQHPHLSYPVPSVPGRPWVKHAHFQWFR